MNMCLMFAAPEHCERELSDFFSPIHVRKSSPPSTPTPTLAGHYASRKEVAMVHPALEPYVRAAKENPAPHPSTVSVLARRTALRDEAQSLRGEPQPVASVRDSEISLEGRALGSRMYVPLHDEGRALVLFFHGGSFIVGDLETHDALCRRLCSDTGMRFLAVNYRLAPEHTFPAGVDDAVEVVRHVAANMSTYASPSAELIVMGDSAGAALVAVACALTRRENLAIAAQVLIYPTLGPEVVTQSSHNYATGYLLELEHLRYDYSQYLGDWSDHTDPRVTPLMFDDLTGAPPAIVVVAQFDPLRDEGVAYAGLLEHFGVRVELLEAEDMVHGFLSLGALIPETLEIVDDLAVHLHRYVEHASS
jgi:acetyl esterase